MILMPVKKSEPNLKNKDERLLILGVDIDNDLYRKTGISGPLLGRVQNLSAASQFALADPQDTDGNAMFYSVKLYDSLKEKDYEVEIATITGSEREGYDADKEIARQLDIVLGRYKADACIFVTDGASDDRVLPIVESRIRINGVRVVKVKQAENIENAYFTILEKLKEPHYAKIVFGLPGILFLLVALSFLLGAGWIPPVIIIGAYLMVKGFGFEDMLINSFRGFGFSAERSSFVFYLGSLLFLVAAIFVGVGSYAQELKVTSDSFLAISYGIEGFMLIIPIMLSLYIAGRFIDMRRTKYYFKSLKYGSYMGAAAVFWILTYSFIAWIIGQIYFSQLVDYIVIGVIIEAAIASSLNLIKRRELRKKRFKDKEVINELGALIGKVASVDVKNGRLVINTSFGNPIVYGIDRIVDVSDKVIIR
jgi:putative membrane protein